MRRLYWVAGAVTAAALAGGFFLNWKAFTNNLLASVVSIVVSVAVAVSLVELLLRERRRREWDRVAQATLGSLRTHLVDVAVQAWIDLGADRPAALNLLLEGRDKLDPACLEGFDDLIGGFRSLGDDPPTQHTYDEVRWDLNQIRDVLIPRILATADDHELVERLIAVEDAERRWMNFLIADRQVVTGGTIRGLIDVLAAARDSYEDLLRRSQAAMGRSGPKSGF